MTPLPPKQQFKLPEWFQILFLISLALGLFLACFVAPLVVTKYVGPLVGTPMAVAVIPIWLYFGPPPMPGLLNGLISISGLLTLVGALLVNITWLISNES